MESLISSFIWTLETEKITTITCIKENHLSQNHILPLHFTSTTLFPLANPHNSLALTLHLSPWCLPIFREQTSPPASDLNWEIAFNVKRDWNMQINQHITDFSHERSCIVTLLFPFIESPRRSMLDSIVFACKRSKRRQSSLIDSIFCFLPSFILEFSNDFIGIPFKKSMFYLLFRASIKDCPFFVDFWLWGNLCFDSCLRYFIKFSHPESSSKNAEASSLLEAISLKLSFSNVAASFRVI